ncbi:hypothetical protein JHD50_11420 [Sulfurimonas sp. MAG313]|nr:hypothetical protein [Sulfurimonas sp. MAG313]MDF1881898.1 hypothetical protein [Sulfurimonas sp. MAG313]
MYKFILFAFFTHALFAQTYEEYLNSQNEAFSSFKEKRDKEFSSFLNKEWKAFKQSQGQAVYEEKKPKELPKAIIRKHKVKDLIELRIMDPKSKKVKVIELKKSSKKIEVVRVAKVIEKKVKEYKKIIIIPSSKSFKTLYLNYYGVDLQLHYDISMLLSMNRSISKNDISKAWDSLAYSKYEMTLNELESISKKLQLNGWGKFLLVKKVSNALYKSSNEAKVFTWFSMLKMGYDAHIAFQEHRLVLLVPIKGNLYNTVYYALNGKNYYAINYYAKGRLGSIVTYDNVYEGADKSIDFEMKVLPLFTPSKVQKRFTFSLENKLESLILSYDENLLKFFKTFPQVSYENYFSSSQTLLLQNSIKDSFTPLLKGKSQNEALDIILNFVQNAFKYKVDEKQFNMEKVMFPSETLFYTYSDCEDRAILFTYMVKTLLNVEVLGIKYPNHMATAVYIKDKVEGEYIRSRNRTYVLADPTYINASIGMSMPQFRGTSSYVIVSTGGEK